MKEYTKEMRENREPCPYCGFWHSAVSHPNQFFGYIVAIKELEEENAAMKSELETRGIGSEQALTDICKILKAPGWEYPGQVVRDVNYLVERSKAVIVALDAYRNDDNVPDSGDLELAIDNLAAYLDGKLKVDFPPRSLR